MILMVTTMVRRLVLDRWGLQTARGMASHPKVQKMDVGWAALLALYLVNHLGFQKASQKAQDWVLVKEHSIQ